MKHNYMYMHTQVERKTKLIYINTESMYPQFHIIASN